MGANPVGQLVCSPLLGLWANRAASPRAPLAATLALFVAASALYASLHETRPHALAALLLARFLVGVSSANVAVVRSYMSAATLVQERTKVVAAGSLAQVRQFSRLVLRLMQLKHAINHYRSLCRFVVKNVVLLYPNKDSSRVFILVPISSAMLL